MLFKETPQQPVPESAPNHNLSGSEKFREDFLEFEGRLLTDLALQYDITVGTVKRIFTEAFSEFAYVQNGAIHITNKEALAEFIENEKQFRDRKKRSTHSARKKLDDIAHDNVPVRLWPQDNPIPNKYRP